jgi:hypothetical protein
MGRALILGVSLLLIAALQTPARAAGHVVGAGTQSCSVWGKARSANPQTTADTIYYTSMTNWMLGYVSLLSSATDNDPPSRETMEAYMDDYCAKHPLSFFYEGVQQLTVEWKKQGTVAPTQP